MYDKMKVIHEKLTYEKVKGDDKEHIFKIYIFNIDEDAIAEGQHKQT